MPSSREGARVVVADVAEEAGAALADEIGPGAEFVVLDVSYADAWDGSSRG